MIKTYGCSFTQYRWQTWPNFLKIFSKQTVENFGIPGASNEIICRTICKTAKKDDIIVVMWSGFDRVHSDIFYRKNKFCEGKYNIRSDRKDNDYAYSLEQLYDRLSHKRIGKEIKDTHPAPSEHYFYCKEVICPALGIKTFDIPIDQLKKLDDARN